MSRKVCVVTGSRAEFGLLRLLMAEIAAASGLELQVVATGTHLAPEFGSTYREIQDAGFSIDARVQMLVSGDSATATSKSIGLGVIGFADVLERLSPDLVLVLGDRFEILAAVTAAMMARIPIAHLHGGEVTEGAIDDAIRHAITKMSHLHFVATDDYRRRVVQMGEHPGRVFDVGGLGVDAISRMELLDKASLEESLGFALGERSLLVTFHPVTLADVSAGTTQMDELLAAIADLQDVRVVFTMPNADTGGRQLDQLLRRFVAEHENAAYFPSLGQLRYLSMMRLAAAVVGNSSSGIAEAPSFRVPTVNIGDRQKGRLQAASIVNCAPLRADIGAAIREVLSDGFRRGLPAVRNPYGEGGAAARVAKVLAEYPLEGLLAKQFHDLPESPDAVN